MESKTLSKAKKSLDMAIKVADNSQELENGKEYHINLSMLGTGKNEGTLQSFQGTVTFQDGVGRVSSNLYKQLGMGASIKFSNNNIELHGKDTDGFAISSTPNGINIIGREKDEQEIELDSTTPTTSNTHQKESLSKNLSDIKDAKSQLLDKKDKEQRQHRQDLKSESNRLFEEDFQHTLRDMNRIMRMLLILEEMNYKAADNLAMSQILSESWKTSDIIASKLALEETHHDLHSLINNVDQLELMFQSGATTQVSNYLSNPNLNDPHFIDKMPPDERRWFIKQNRDIITKIANDNGKYTPEEIRAVGNALFSSFGIDFFDPKYDEKKSYRFRVVGGNEKLSFPFGKKLNGDKNTPKENKPQLESSTTTPQNTKQTDQSLPGNDKRDTQTVDKTSISSGKLFYRELLKGKTVEEIKQIKLGPGKVFDETAGTICKVQQDGSLKPLYSLKFNENGQVEKTQIFGQRKHQAVRDLSKFFGKENSQIQLTTDATVHNESTVTTSSNESVRQDSSRNTQSPEGNPTEKTDGVTDTKTSPEKETVPVEHSRRVEFQEGDLHYAVDWNGVLDNSTYNNQHYHLNHQIEGANDQLSIFCAEAEQLTINQEQELADLDASFDERTFRLLIRHLKMSKLDMKQELSKESTLLENDKSLSQSKRKQLLIKKQEEIQKSQQKKLLEELLKQKLEQRTHIARLLIRQSKERLKMVKLIKEKNDEIERLCEQQPTCQIVDCDSLDELYHIQSNLSDAISKIDAMYEEAVKSGRADLIQILQGAKKVLKTKQEDNNASIKKIQGKKNRDSLKQSTEVRRADGTVLKSQNKQAFIEPFTTIRNKITNNTSDNTKYEQFIKDSAINHYAAEFEHDSFDYTNNTLGDYANALAEITSSKPTTMEEIAAEKSIVVRQEYFTAISKAFTVAEAAKSRAQAKAIKNELKNNMGAYTENAIPASGK